MGDHLVLEPIQGAPLARDVEWVRNARLESALVPHIGCDDFVYHHRPVNLDDRRIRAQPEESTVSTGLRDSLRAMFASLR